MKFTREQARLAENLQMVYRGWMDQQRRALDIPSRLNWKSSGGREYLYSIRNSRGDGSSLGPRSAETEALYARYEAYKAQMARDAETLKELSGLYRALRLPVISEQAGELLRELDQRSLLGLDGVLVVGTNTMGAYEMATASRFATGLDATEDFDLCWAAEKSVVFSVAGDSGPLMSALKAVDPTYTVNMERPFQARNADHYEVEVLLAPSRRDTYPVHESLRPVDNLPEQEWLLLGRPLDEVLMDRKGLPCRLVVPDPRWMALHKLWLADKPERNPRKKGKDRAQGLALMKMIPTELPHYPLDDSFWRGVPPELQKYRPG